LLGDDDSFAEYERPLIASRTRATLAAKRRRGERMSGIAPFGCHLSTNGGTLEPYPPERRVLATIESLQAAGRSLRMIARFLNQRGWRALTGTPWQYGLREVLA
jgi:DNA invertase Pin-like site-specific DNA recombinase